MNDFHNAEEKFHCMVKQFKESSIAWLDKVECELHEEGRDLARMLLQGHIDSRGFGDVGQEILTNENDRLSHKRVISRAIKTLFGSIVVKRIGYSTRNHSTIFPMDACLNLPNSSFSFSLQRFLARRVAVTALSEAITVTAEMTGVSIGRRQAMQIVESCAKDFDAFYLIKDHGAQTEDDLLILTTDGKGIVMRNDYLREGTKQKAIEAKQKMKTRLARGEKSNRKRMAQVASIYFVSRFIRHPQDVMSELRREALQTKRPRAIQKRVWASVEKDSKDVIFDLFSEAKQLDPQHQKNWVILIDGNRSQLRTIKSMIQKETVDAVIILDIIHVIEYLWNVARIFIGESNHHACETWVTEKLQKILEGHARKVAGGIRISASKRELSSAKKDTVRVCAKYIADHAEYMNYATYLQSGFPIATGVIEGACRYLIKDRMDITGARWGLSGAEAVLKLRSLVTSGDFDDYWSYYVQSEYKRNYAANVSDLERLCEKLAS